MNTFENILKNTIIPSDLSIEDRIARMKDLVDYVNSNIPMFLYKYRTCNEQSIDAFYKDQLWVSVSEKMNDAYDSSIFFDKKAIEEWIEAATSNNVINSIRALLDHNLIPLEFRCISNIEDVFNKIKKIDRKEMYKIISSFRDKVKNNYLYNLDKITYILQNQIKILCLSSDIHSTLMWGHYSDKETGFALSYSFENNSIIKKEKTEMALLYPIVYSDKRYRVPDNEIVYLLKKFLIYNFFLDYFPEQLANYFSSILFCPDTLMVTKILLHKASKWSYEKEWRVICHTNDEKRRIVPSFPIYIKPNGLYLGRKIDIKNEERLINIANEKNIPIYKMKLNESEPIYELEFEKIERF